MSGEPGGMLGGWRGVIVGGGEGVGGGGRVGGRERDGEDEIRGRLVSRVGVVKFNRRKERREGRVKVGISDIRKTQVESGREKGERKPHACAMTERGVMCMCTRVRTYTAWTHVGNSNSEDEERPRTESSGMNGKTAKEMGKETLASITTHPVPPPLPRCGRGGSRSWRSFVPARRMLVVV